MQQRPRSSTPPPAAAAAGTAAAGDVAQLLALPYPPVQPLIGNEEGSFAQDTITTRLPAIMDTVLADLQAQGEGGSAELQQQLAAAAQAVKQMQADMPADAPLPHLSLPPGLPPSHPLAAIIPTTNASLDAWRQHIGASAASWLQLPWLVVECYLYVRLATIIASQPLLLAAQYDPFSRQKAAALSKSLGAAADLAVTLQQLVADAEAAAAAAAAGGSDGSQQQQQARLAALTDEAAKQRFFQLVQYALWGNKTDLSMLVDVSAIDPAALSGLAAAAAGGSSSSSNVIVDEFEALWAHMTASGSAAAASGSAAAAAAAAAAPLLARVDIILDNAGLELYTDLALADYLVSSGLAGQVVLHGKQLPWFVSDTLQHDLQHLLDTCSSADSSSGSSASLAPDAAAAMAAAARRWSSHLAAGRWSFVADVFWTTPHPFWWMQQLAPALHASLAASQLLVFKGDLNYRKLAGDCRWPPPTPFATALAGFCPSPLVTLRTLKADVIAGLAPGEAEALDTLDPRWQVNGRFGVVQFCESA